MRKMVAGNVVFIEGTLYRFTSEKKLQIGSVILDNNLNVIYTIETEEGKRYFCDHVVIATGGKSYAQLGSDGKGYELGKSLGHTIVTPRPALTDVRLKNTPYKTLAGVSLQNVGLTIWRNGKKDMCLRRRASGFLKTGLRRQQLC